MKRKIIKTLSAFLAICILLTVPIFAHSGRTDASGGHRDNKNKSGLGYYHYHHGYGPHLHTNGVCPYDYVSTISTNQKSQSESKSSITKSSKQSSTSSTEIKTGIVATDIKTFINWYEVPTFYYNGESKGTVVIVEDLRNYGFDKVWDNDNRTLTLIKNTEKEITPMIMDYYHELEQGQFLYDIYDSDIKVYLKNSLEGELIEPKKVYFLNGYTAISTDELVNFGSLTWDGENRKTVVTIN